MSHVHMSHTRVSGWMNTGTIAPLVRAWARGDAQILPVIKFESTLYLHLHMHIHVQTRICTRIHTYWIYILTYRHNNNTLVTGRGLLIGIDFGIAFGKGAWALPVPELLPFRLTKQMLGVLSPLDSKVWIHRWIYACIYMQVYIYDLKAPSFNPKRSLLLTCVREHAHVLQTYIKRHCSSGQWRVCCQRYALTSSCWSKTWVSSSTILPWTGLLTASTDKVVQKEARMEGRKEVREMSVSWRSEWKCWILNSMANTRVISWNANYKATLGNTWRELTRVWTLFSNGLVEAIAKNLAHLQGVGELLIVVATILGRSCWMLEIRSFFVYLNMNERHIHTWVYSSGAASSEQQYLSVGTQVFLLWTHHTHTHTHTHTHIHAHMYVYVYTCIHT